MTKSASVQMMKAPAKPSRIPVFTSLRQNHSRGCSAPTGINNGFIPNENFRHASNSAGEPGSNVRDFFKQRKNIDDNYPLQNIKHHYNQFKSSVSPTRAKPRPIPPPQNPQMKVPSSRHRNEWNKSCPLPALRTGNSNYSSSSENNIRENSDSSGLSAGSELNDERPESIEEMQRRQRQEDVLALIAEKEKELHKMRSIQQQRLAEEQRQKERERLKRSKPRVKQLDWQDSSPEHSNHSRKWSSEEQKHATSPREDIMPRKPVTVKHKAGQSAPMEQAQHEPSPPESKPPAKGGYAMEISLSPPLPRHSRKTSPPPRESTPPRHPSPPPPKRKQPPQKKGTESPKQKSKAPQNKRLDQLGYDVPLDATYEPPTNLLPCRVCGRKFAEERIKKHEKACNKADKAQAKRKVFDPVKMRTQGTEAAQYVNKKHQQEEPKKPKKDWRKAHEELLKTLRYNKKVSEYEKNGGNIADLPPPPPTEHPDYVECPYCSRKFNEGAAERHIPKCKETKNRPPPPRGGGRRR